jgi:putative nucleotidyltransferase with HDIG domain
MLIRDISMKTIEKIDYLTYNKAINRPRLTIILLILSLISSLLIGLVLLFSNWKIPATILFLFSSICVILIIIYIAGRHNLAANGLITLFPLMLTVIVIEGEGLHDPGLSGYMILIVFSTLLRGKQYLPIVTIISIMCVLLVFAIEQTNFLGWVSDIRFVSSKEDLLVSIVMLIVLGVILWFMMGIIDANILRAVESEQNIKEAYDLTLEGWARALELRDKETEGHSRRVTELVLEIARELGVESEDIQHIRRGSLLHDIGKMAIPDRILQKPSELNEEEWAIIKKHPEHARKMLAQIKYLAPAVEIPYYHHERWDGQGYPEGLSGNSIPLSARIFSVVDNWDALTSDRPYRKAWSEETVLSYIQEEAGKKFDPQIVEIFLKVIKKSLA